MGKNKRLYKRKAMRDGKRQYKIYEWGILDNKDGGTAEGFTSGLWKMVYGIQKIYSMSKKWNV